jgi:hypothetical protein
MDKNEERVRNTTLVQLWNDEIVDRERIDTGEMSDRSLPLSAAVDCRRHRRLFVVKASNDQPLVFIYYGEGVARRSLARLLTRSAARWIAAGMAKLPSLLSKG